MSKRWINLDVETGATQEVAHSGTQILPRG